jgi:O-antigen/teichoic acid export membrane protein
MVEKSAEGSLILIIGQMCSTLVSALGSILVARILGSTSYGIISIAQIPINLFSMLIQNGLGSATINYLIQNRHEENREKIGSIILTSYIINVILGFIATTSIYLLAGYFANFVFKNQDLLQLIRIISFTVIAQSILGVSSSVLIGLEKMTQRSILTILVSSLKSFIGPLLVYLGYGVLGAAYGQSTPIIITALFSLLMIYLNLQKIVTSYKLYYEDFKSLIIYSYPLFFSYLLSSSLTNMLNFILPLYVSATIIGNLNAAKSFTVLLSFLIIPIVTATFPLLSKLKTGDPVLKFVFQNIIKYQTMIAYPVAATVIAFSNQLVNLFYGKDYIFSPLYLRIQMLNYIFVGFGDKVDINLLNSQKKTRVTFTRALIYLILGTPIGFYLIPKFGVIGIQVTTIIVPEFGLIYTLWWLKKNMNISVDFRTSIKIFLSTFIGYISCKLFLNLINFYPIVELILGTGVLFIVYLFSLLLTGSLTKKNITDIKDLIHRNKIMRKFTDPIFDFLRKVARFS